MSAIFDSNMAAIQISTATPNSNYIHTQFEHTDTLPVSCVRAKWLTGNRVTLFIYSIHNENAKVGIVTKIVFKIILILVIKSTFRFAHH